MCAAFVLRPAPAVRDVVLVEVLDRLEDPVVPGVADVVVGHRHPVEAGVLERGDVGGVRGEHGARRVEAPVVGGRVLEVGDGDVGALRQVAERAGVCPARFVYAVSQPNGEQSLHVPVMSAEAAVEREVGARGVVVDGELHAPIEQDVAARDHRPGAAPGRSPAACRSPASSVACSGQLSSELTRSSPNSALVPQPSARTTGPTSSARRNPMSRRFSVSRFASAAARGDGHQRLPSASRWRASARSTASASASTSTMWSNASRRRRGLGRRRGSRTTGATGSSSRGRWRRRRRRGRRRGRRGVGRSPMAPPAPVVGIGRRGDALGSDGILRPMTWPRDSLGAADGPPPKAPVTTATPTRSRRRPRARRRRTAASAGRSGWTRWAPSRRLRSRRVEPRVADAHRGSVQDTARRVRGKSGAPSGRADGAREEANRKVADPTGFEPAISSVTGWHVGPLHHGSSAGGG